MSACGRSSGSVGRYRFSNENEDISTYSSRIWLKFAGVVENAVFLIVLVRNRRSPYEGVCVFFS